MGFPALGEGTLQLTSEIVRSIRKQKLVPRLYGLSHG